MHKLLATAGAIAVLALTSTPAAAVTPTTQATATAKIYKPLQISFVQNLDFGTIVLTGSSFTGETVTMDTGGGVTCGTTAGDLTCSGAPQPAKYHLIGSNNAVVTVTSPGFNLSDGAGHNLAFVTTFATPLTSTTGSVNLGSTGATDFSLGGTISGLSNTTPDGVYSADFSVTADYQ
jgi:uncharacterized protein DUF4402